MDESEPYLEAVQQYTESIALNPNDAKVGQGVPVLCSLATALPRILNPAHVSS